MSIASEITRIGGNIAAAYTAAENNGAALPQIQNSANLAGTIDTISDQPTLNAPTLSRSGNTISITDPSNGSFVSGYKIYHSGIEIGSTAASSFTLTGLGAGQYALYIKAYGTGFKNSAPSNVINAAVYTVERTLTNLTANDSSMLISDDQTYAVTLTPASGYYLPDNITVNIGGSALSDYTYNQETGVVAIPNVNGNVSIMATASDAPALSPIYGVSGLYSSSPALTRTDDAVGMDFVINSSSGAVVSDFDSVFPWNEAQIVTLDAGKFLRLPTMYFRVGTDSSNRITDIAVSKEAGDSGDWYEVEGFDVSCYGASFNNSMLKSITGIWRGSDRTRASFRQRAANTGTGYYQYDFYHHTVLQFLWLIEFATKDSASIMTGRISGSGTSGGNTGCWTGGTDGLSTPSGFETAYAQMRWHYIEDFVGNYRELYDGIISTAPNAPSYVTTDPSKFSDTDTSNLSALAFNNANTGNGTCIAALGWDADHPFFAVPIETVNDNTYTTYFCSSYSSTSGCPILFGLSYYGSNAASCGLFSLAANFADSHGSVMGSRLLHTPS